MLSSDFINMLACPVCNGELQLAEPDLTLLCRTCRLAFPVRDGIPVLLVDQAEKISC